MQAEFAHTSWVSGCYSREKDMIVARSLHDVLSKACAPSRV